MKATLIALLFSFVLLACNNNSQQTASTSTTDSVSQSVISKLIHNSSQADSAIALPTESDDSVNESDVLISGYSIMTLSEQKMVKLLSQADSIRRDSDKKINAIINRYSIGKSSFDYWNGKLFVFRIHDNHLPFQYLERKLKLEII
jgi:hypothetical protein